MTYKILAQFNTPKDINVTVSNSLWPNIPGLPPTVIGKIIQWQHKENKTLRINWKEADGTYKYDTEFLAYRRDSILGSLFAALAAHHAAQ